MEKIPVKLVFYRRKRVGRRSWNAAFAQITFPIAHKPKMLPDEGGLQLYIAGYVNEKLRQVRFEFSLTPHDADEHLAGASMVDTVIGLDEVWIQIRNVDQAVPLGWITKPKKFVTGMLEDKDSSFIVAYSLD